MIGRALSHYRITEKLGEGGMGEVYKALDTKLGREVAIKVLPEAFAENKERLARFGREARLLASLNHPNIATIHGLEESGGVRFLVMELVEGETLAERIAKGPVSAEDALPLFKQIAEGLEAAHEKGVIHRDLKPANIKVTPEGKVKVLDFGLAKAMEPEVPDADLSQSPTLTKGTALGAIMGTAAYMSPEQARGRQVDKRTDIWAFGCCLYEALTGKKAFEGETVTDTLAAVVNKEPDWDALPQTVPSRVRELVRWSLRKDRVGRLHDIADARIQIDDALDEPTEQPLEPARQRASAWVVALVAAGAALVAGLAVWGMMRSTPVQQPHSRFAINLPDEAPVDLTGTLALSPDGTKLVYVVQRMELSQLYIRDIEKFEAEPIPGTEGASYPFLSPDGEWIGYFDAPASKLEKVWLHGGAPVEICESTFGRGASWGVDGTIVFDRVAGGSLYRVPASGGEPQIVATPDREKGEKLFRFPQILPDGESALFIVVTSTRSSWDDATIAAVSLRSGERKVLIEGGTKPLYLPTGHIVYSRAGSLMAVPFDRGRLEVTGKPVEVLEGIAANSGTGDASFSLSQNGTLVYAPGGRDFNFRRLVSVDRKGDVQPIALESNGYFDVRVSPSGKWLALQISGANEQIWLYELERETLTRLTSSWDNTGPRWTPDGNRVTYASSGDPALFWKPVDGSGPEEEIQSGEQSPESWSPDGKLLAYRVGHPATRVDIWLLSMDGKRRARPFLVTEFNELGAEFSPDGRWLAYCSDETGRLEAFVRPVSGAGGRVQISTNGGSQPGWSPNGREIFYRQDNKMMAVPVESGERLVAGKPEVLFEMETAAAVPFRTYGITPEGRFVMIQPLHKPSSTQLHVVQNWFDELKRLVPTN